MRCMTCSADIPPQWVAAIAKNLCPGCDGPIMDDASKVLLTELKEAMGKMPNDPEGLAGWLLSNYVLTKVGDAEPTHFNRKPAQARNSGRKEPRLKVAKNPVHDFLKRTNASKGLENRPDLRELVNNINSGNVDEELYGNGEELDQEDEEAISAQDYPEDYTAEDYSGESIEAEDLDPYEEAESNRRNFRSVKSAAENNSLVLPGTPGQRPLSRQDQAAMAAAMKGGGPNLDAVAALNEARKARLQKSRDVATGGGQGSFRRN